MASRMKYNYTALVLSVLLAYGARSVIGSGCVDSSTIMFGAPWQPSFIVSEQETQHQERGDISHLKLYYNTATGCIEGLTASYGFASSITATLGVDLDTATDSSALVPLELTLSPKEVVDGVEYKVGNCIEYLKFSTNNGNTLEAGNSDSPNSLQSSKPAPGSYLGFFKGTVDPSVTVTEESGTALPLQQLQLVWVNKDCSGKVDGDVIIPANAGIDAAAAANRLRVTRSQQNPQQAKAAVSGKQDMRVAQAAAPVPAGDAVDKEVRMPSAGPTFGDDAEALVTAAARFQGNAVADANSSCAPKGCDDGICATSSCTLNGMGREAAAMLCFGTNIIPNLMKDQVAVNPCSNLACKLTKPNCTSTGLLGIGGFCTGRVVAMGATAELHDAGRKLVGHPCLEHRGIITEMVPKFGDYSAKGTYVAKAWKVCDCTPVTSHGSVELSDSPSKHDATTVRITTPSIRLTADDISAVLANQQIVKIPDLDIDLSDRMQMLQKPLIDMTMPDVVMQWMTAFASKLTVPRLNITDAKLDALKALVPGFTAPALIVPNISASLLKVPLTIDIPTFTIPEKTFPLVALLLPNITNSSLPSLVVPSKLPSGVKLPAAFDIRNITSLNGVLERFILGLPNYNFTLPQIMPAIEVPDVLNQWIAGFRSNSPLPKIQVTNETLSQLRTLLPQLPQLPAMISYEVAVPWLNTDAASNIATFVIPDNLVSQVKQLLPDLTDLPTILERQDVFVEIPILTVPNITLSSFKDQLTKIMDRIPTVSTLTSGNKEAQSIDILDQISNAAESIGLAIQQAFNKQAGAGVGFNLAGLNMARPQAPASSAPSSSNTAKALPAPEELPVDTTEDEGDSTVDDTAVTPSGGVIGSETQPVI